jgi:hypothetical protein
VLVLVHLVWVLLCKVVTYLHLMPSSKNEWSWGAQLTLPLRNAVAVDLCTAAIMSGSFPA